MVVNIRLPHPQILLNFITRANKLLLKDCFMVIKVLILLNKP